MSTKVAVVGLGSMGFGMAQSLLRGGLKTWGFDISAERQAAWQAEGGAQGELHEIAGELDAICIVVLNSVQTESVLFGDQGIVTMMKPGSVVLGCATVAPEFARDMETRCAAAGIHYLDAPISGGAAKAAIGRLSVMASGTKDAFEQAAPVLDATAENVFELGDTAGNGSAMKAVNQMLAGSHIALMAEAITFGMTQGIQPKTFLDVISQCAGNSWMLENRAPHIVDGDYTPRSSVNIWPKDLGIVLDIAENANFDAPMTATALKQFLSAADAGLGAEDDAAVAKIYAQKSNLTLPGTEAEAT
ncbi:MAG: NAD(P)-dependent oxidoreductase [Granulosicoccus sp.]|nr:NAD(P)-dependent oxidoreductase [Granulosicoccus sp.]